MALAAGARLGVYEVVSLLGRGGMGDVYRARDLRLGRDVAIKVLRGSVAADAGRVRRFEREARLLAALSHPHIGAIHGLEETSGEPALILELVEGPTLADRLAAGPLPLQEALNVARQIAEALEAAHEKGIIHRDLKPANVKVTANGIVKVLDFGLAKAFVGDGPDDVALSPTVTIDATAEGLISGTPAYMSPEQATGRPIDKRTDIWSFGVLLFETLTGKRLFTGASVSDVLAGVLKTEPDWNGLPAATPPAIRTLLRRCLTRDVKRRLQDIGEARIALEDTSAHAVGTGDANLVGHPHRDRIAWTVAAAALVLTLAAVTALYVRQGARTAAPSMHVEINTPQTADPFSIAISPDGRRLAFVGRSGDVERMLWIRSLDAPVAQPLPGTEAASHPFWSPDSRSIGFFSVGTLKRIDLGGTAPQVVCSACAFGVLGGTWSANGVIVFGGLTSPLRQVSASGGDAVAITTLERPQDSHRWPFFLPDGRHLLFMSGFVGRTAEVRLLTLGETESRHLLQADSATAYGFGHLFYLRDGALVAHQFDAANQELIGAPIPVADHVAFQQNRSEAAYSVSATGAIAYRASRPARRQAIWVDRSGRELGTLGEYEGSSIGTLELEPHGKRVAFSWTWTEGNTDIYVMEADQSTARRFTLAAKADFNNIWSPDGSRIVFSSDRNGSYDLYQKLSTGAGPEEALLESRLGKFPSDWSPDGRFLLYWQDHPETQNDLWVLPMDGDRKPRPFVEDALQQLRGRFSPDGKWVAYQSNENGRLEIYVQAFPGPGGKWLVSTGHSPRWARSGNELHYLAEDGTLMTAPIRAKADVFEAGTPTALFQTRLENRRSGPCHYCMPNYDVDADGRFLMTVVAEEPSAPINLILNWPTLLKK